MSKGVLIIAGGHANYGRMAFNLAMSIKQNDDTIPIALAHNGSSITKLYGNMIDVFDQLIQIPTEYYKNGLKDDWFKCKTFMYDLSPFEQTVVMDADTLWLPKSKISSVFNELKKVKYTMANRDFLEMKDAPFKENYSMWCNVHEVKAAFRCKDTDKYYSIHSEFVYFTKCESNKKFFDKAKEIFNEPRITPRQFATSIPDEYAFAVAQMLTKTYPHKTPYLPGYWHVAEKHNKIKDGDMYRLYKYISIGGVEIPKPGEELYNRLSRIYAQKYGATDYYKYVEKRKWLEERKLI